jgi:long-chain fatty acid transport protein
MKKITVSVILSILMASTVHAASVDTFGIGAKATSLGGAVSASSDDVFSIYYNPAGLSQMKGPEVSAALQLADPNLKCHNYTLTGGENAAGTDLPDQGGVSFSDKSSDLYIPSFGYAQPVTSSISVGVAAYIPFGLDVEWERDPAKNPGAYNWFHSYYIRETVNPTMSYKINNAFSVGAGVALGKSRSGAEKILNYPVAPSDANVAFTGHDTYDPAFAALVGTAYGAAAQQAYTALALTHAVNGSRLKIELEDSFNYSFNAGMLYKPSGTFAAGLTFRGRADADFDGDVSIDGVKVATAKQSYDHPEQIQAGIMVKPVNNVSMEVDVVWTHWAINKTQVTYFDTPLLGLLSSETLERNWHNTNQIRIGVEWQVNDFLALRAGYFYDPSPVPDDTFDIMWPDADRKTYSIGAGFNITKNLSVDTSLQFAYAETKRIIGGESDNLNDSYNTPGVIDGYKVEASADGYLLGYGVSVNYKF